MRLTRVSGPTQCAVGPSLKSKEAWWVMATHAVTSVAVGFMGWAPCFLDLPLWNLNAPYAMHKKSHSVDNPW